MGTIKTLFALTTAMGAILAAPAPALAQVNPVLTGAARGIEDNQSDQAGARLSILELKGEARIAGRVADVTLELLVGTTGAQDEARLSLALPNDAVVTGYALDVEGRLIPGALIEQPKARNVYQDEVRKGIDPGLAEVTAQNVFSTRIYPVTPDHPRRIRVTFSMPYDPEKGFDLPLGTDAAVGRIDLSVSVEGYAEAPSLHLAGQDVALNRKGSGWSGSISADHAAVRGGIAVSGGRIAAPLEIVRHGSGDSFFVLSDTADAVPARSASGGRLRVYWDRSLSHRLARTEDEIAAVTALAAQMQATGIDLVTFASDRPQVTTVTSESALRAALNAVTYRGGTSLAGLDALQLADADQCVLVFDGQVTIDHEVSFAPACRTAVLTAAPGADGTRLARLAQRLHGQFVRIAPNKGADAARQMTGQGFAVTDVRTTDGQRIDWRSLPAPAGGWMLIGRMPADTALPSPAAIQVRIAGPGGTITRSYSSSGAAIRADAAGALWASDRVAELGDDPAQHDAMVALARRYQVAGPQLAFLVLESPEQYLRADVAAPDGFSAEWMARYREARDASAKAKQDSRQQRFDFVLGQWQERRAWWGRSFVPPPRPKVRAAGTASPGAGDQIAVTGAVLNAPPPPAPPPPPVVAPERALPAPVPPSVNPAAADSCCASGDDAELVVTANRVQQSVQDVPVAVTTVSSETVNRREAGTETDARPITLKLEEVLANRPYLAALASASPADRIKVLGEQELAYGSIPTFYLDTSEWFRLKGDAATSELLLLSALELATSDDETRQIVAFRLEREHRLDRAVDMAERFAANATFRPQPKRILALALAARGKSHGRAGRADLERAFKLLTEVALDPFEVDANSDFDGIETIALMEANALIPAIEAAGGSWALDRRLTGLTDTDVRIVIDWTADDADVDLWVDEPNGERVYYASKLSTAGGQISNDMTDGYGPEEYAIHHAPRGPYEVRVNGFDADRLNPNGPGHVMVRLIRNFGRASQQEQLVDVDLAFQRGANRNSEDGDKPVAVLQVGQ